MKLNLLFNIRTPRIIAITGTNGKTTTTLLTYHLMKEAGVNVGLPVMWARAWRARWPLNRLTGTCSK